MVVKFKLGDLVKIIKRPDCGEPCSGDGCVGWIGRIEEPDYAPDYEFYVKFNDIPEKLKHPDQHGGCDFDEEDIKHYRKYNYMKGKNEV